MTYIEDSWVAAATGVVHQVFSINYELYTQCGRWLAVDSVRPSTYGPQPPVGVRLCKSCERQYRKAVRA